MHTFSHGHRETLCDGLVDIRCGRWQDVLADVGRCDAVITDPPYSERTHEGHNAASGRDPGTTTDPGKIGRPINYALWRPSDVEEFVARWSPAAAGWMCVFNSHDMMPKIEGECQKAGRYVFAPLPLYQPGSRIRLAGDGPSSWTTWLLVARPSTRAMQRWGTLPGGYAGPSEEMIVVGGKPLWALRSIVRDYSRPGDLVVDPFCGGGTTALACAIEGRRCITSEMDPDTYAKAVERLRRGFTPSMFSQSKKSKAKQGAML